MHTGRHDVLEHITLKIQSVIHVQLWACGTSLYVLSAGQAMSVFQDYLLILPECIVPNPHCLKWFRILKLSPFCENVFDIYAQLLQALELVNRP